MKGEAQGCPGLCTGLCLEPQGLSTVLRPAAAQSRRLPVASGQGGGRVGAVSTGSGRRQTQSVSQRGCEIISFIYGSRISVATQAFLELRRAGATLAAERGLLAAAAALVAEHTL